MPELPEVRTVADILKKQLLDKKITAIQIIYPKIIEKDSLDLKNLINQKLIDIQTNGKYLLFDFDKYILISHLRMEGKYFIKEINEKIIKHEHIIFTLDNKVSLRYHDTRKFGKMQLIKKEDLKTNKSISKLADEPFNINETELYNKITKKAVPIKAILLDQTIINGLGNIYANEVLFASEIHPLKLGKEITKEEIKKIITSSIEILNQAIKEGGTTIKSYTSSLGVNGNYQSFLKVHIKEGTPCFKCHNPIQKIQIGGRSTYFCSNCQK